MKVRMRGEISGARNGVPWPARGKVIDLGDAEAATLCSQGMAEPVAETDDQRAETATAPAAETRKAEPAAADAEEPKKATARAATKAAS